MDVSQNTLPSLPLSRSNRSEGEAGAVAYVMNGFPRLSETFITHEIYQLEQLGMRLRLFSVKREHESQVQPVVAAVRSPIVYLPSASSLSRTSLPLWLARNLPKFARANAAVAVRHPVRYLRTLGSALALSWRHRARTASGLRLRKVFIKEFLQAAEIAAHLRRAGHRATEASRRPARSRVRAGGRQPQRGRRRGRW